MQKWQCSYFTRLISMWVIHQLFFILFVTAMIKIIQFAKIIYPKPCQWPTKYHATNNYNDQGGQEELKFKGFTEKFIYFNIITLRMIKSTTLCFITIGNIYHAKIIRSGNIHTSHVWSLYAPEAQGKTLVEVAYDCNIHLPATQGHWASSSSSNDREL